MTKREKITNIIAIIMIAIYFVVTSLVNMYHNYKDKPTIAEIQESGKVKEFCNSHCLPEETCTRQWFTLYKTYKCVKSPNTDYRCQKLCVYDIQ